MMRHLTWLFGALTMTLVVGLTFVLCWQVLTVPPPCNYDCVKVVGPGNCDEFSQGADQFHNDPACRGVGKCHPVSGNQVDFIHELFDACKPPIGLYHRQHVTTVTWDTDNDGIKDTKCEALHSCPP